MRPPLNRTPCGLSPMEFQPAACCCTVSAGRSKGVVIFELQLVFGLAQCAAFVAANLLHPLKLYSISVEPKINDLN